MSSWIPPVTENSPPLVIADLNLWFIVTDIFRPCRTSLIPLYQNNPSNNWKEWLLSPFQLQLVELMNLALELLSFWCTFHLQVALPISSLTGHEPERNTMSWTAAEQNRAKQFCSPSSVLFNSAAHHNRLCSFWKNIVFQTPSFDPEYRRLLNSCSDWPIIYWRVWRSLVDRQFWGKKGRILLTAWVSFVHNSGVDP